MREDHDVSLARLARAFAEPRSTVGRWIGEPASAGGAPCRVRPVADDATLREAVRAEAMRPRQQGFGYRRITAALRRKGWTVNRKTVYRAMQAEGLLQDRIRYKPARPKRVEKMRPERPNQGSQIDITSLQLSVRGQYPGYDGPDDNAYVARVIRTIKEEEIWPNQWDTWSEAHAAIEAYVRYYNSERIHSALGYRTPNEAAAAYVTLAAA